MVRNNYEKGKYGENLACDYLIKNNYEIIDRNYNTINAGEIDIIAKKDSYIIFIEVKYRKNTKNGYHREAVNTEKQNRIKKTAMYFIYEKNIEDNNFRFDVIEILDNKIEHIENAFW